jgi:hypothetical protein
VSLTGAAFAQSPDISALLASWKGQDASMRMVADVIASAFSSGLSWRGSLAGKNIYCPPSGLSGQRIMSAFEQFLADNPCVAERALRRRRGGDAQPGVLLSGEITASWPTGAFATRA